MEIDFENFYANYSFGYHTYKVATLKSILDNISNFNEKFIEGRVSGFIESEYEHFLRSEIRITCFHSIETLFEIIFALEPEGSLLQDRLLFKRLSTAKQGANYTRVGLIASTVSELDFLDRKITIGNRVVTVGEHIFYFRYSPEQYPEEIRVQVTQSIEAIKTLLQHIAEIFSKRFEYNAYKHGLRIFNAFTEFMITDVDGTNPISFDLSKSASFYTVEKKKDRIVSETVSTKMFNTPKDYAITSLCSLLIGSIIESRKQYLSVESRDSKYSFRIFTKEYILSIIAIKDDSLPKIDDMHFKTQYPDPDQQS